MAVPPSRRRAGKIEIDNKARQIRDELKKREVEKREITIEEHEERLKKLREIGLIK